MYSIFGDSSSSSHTRIQHAWLSPNMEYMNPDKGLLRQSAQQVSSASVRRRPYFKPYMVDLPV